MLLAVRRLNFDCFLEQCFSSAVCTPPVFLSVLFPTCTIPALMQTVCKLIARKKCCHHKSKGQVHSCCHHAGFVRMAIEHNAKLVPVVVLGEVNALQNPIDLPELQRWTYKNLGFPVPYWVVGRWGVLPFPKRSGLKFIIGEPICPRPHVPGAQVKTHHACSRALLPSCLWHVAKRHTSMAVRITHSCSMTLAAVCQQAAHD